MSAHCATILIIHVEHREHWAVLSIKTKFSKTFVLLMMISSNRVTKGNITALVPTSWDSQCLFLVAHEALIVKLGFFLCTTQQEKIHSSHTAGVQFLLIYYTKWHFRQTYSPSDFMTFIFGVINNPKFKLFFMLLSVFASFPPSMPSPLCMRVH